MFYFSKAINFFLLVGLCFCGRPQDRATDNRSFIKKLEANKFNPTFSGEDSELYVDYATTAIGACEWQSRLENAYKDPLYTGRFRVLGSVDFRDPPKVAPESDPLFVFKILLSTVDFVLPKNKFKVPEEVPSKTLPWGRIDMKANSLNSYALMHEGASQIPTREEFLEKVDEALKQKPAGHLKLLAFKSAIALGRIDVDQKRNEIVQLEMEKVFPGYFSEAGTGPLNESFSWVLVKNGLGLEKMLSRSDLEAIKVFDKKLAVFRKGGWPSLAEDMKYGLGAAIGGLSSNNLKERACAANILFRSTEQMLQLMGQETLPLYDSPRQQSYVPSLESVLTGQTSKSFQKCQSAGSILRNGKRQLMSESDLSKLSQNEAHFTFAEQPLPLYFCKPASSKTAFAPLVERPVTVSSSLSNRLSRMDAFAHFLFSYNPAASWWGSLGQLDHPMGDFNSLSGIQKTKSLVPKRIHALGLAFLQLDLLHFEKHHLVFLNEQGERTLNQDEAMGIRLSEHEIGPQAEVAETTLSSTLDFLELLFKFDRYLQTLESWSKTASIKDVEGYFVEEANLNAILGSSEESSRELIGRLYLASSLLLLEFIDQDNKGFCFNKLKTDLISGQEKVEGTCDSSRLQFSRALNRLANKLESPLLQRHAQDLIE